MGPRPGSYEIGVQIGAGEMGEVYRATDTSLGRAVAIKVIPEAFAQDEERLARFEREARTLAALNHPSIAIIHGVERAVRHSRSRPRTDRRPHPGRPHRTGPASTGRSPGD